MGRIKVGVYHLIRVELMYLLTWNTTIEYYPNLKKQHRKEVSGRASYLKLLGKG